MSTLVFVDPKSSTQANGAQSSRLPVPLPKDPYEAIRQAYLVGTDTKSEPYEGEARTSESPHIVAPPTCHVEESEGSGTSDARCTSSDSTAPLSPDHPLTHTTPVLVLTICRSELLRAPTEGYAEAIVVPTILIEHFELKHSLINMMTSDQLFGLEKDDPHDHIRKLKSITTRSGHVLDGPSIHMPPLFINPEEDECAYETLTDQDLAEYTIKVPPPLIQKAKPPSQRNYVVHQRDPPVILKKLPEKLGDLGKFLISCGFSELKCKALADLANRAICTHDEIARDVFAPVGKFTFPADFVIFYYESDPRVPLILGRPFLRTARALIDVYGDEMILRDGDERLTLNMRHDTSSYSNEPQKESTNMINIYDDSYEDYLEDLFATNHLSGNLTFSSHTDLTSPEVINPLSGNHTSSSPNHLLEEFADELALITFPPGIDDLPFDIESALREIKYLLNHDPTKEIDSILEDSVDECNLADPNNNLIDTIPEMFTDEHTLDYSFPPLYESSDFLSSLEYDSFLFEVFSEVDALPSTNNEDKLFNPRILIHENLFVVTVQVTPDKNVKNISISHASLILEDFNPPLFDHELSFHKEVLGSETLLSFSSENEKKVFKLGILTFKGVHTSLLLSARMVVRVLPVMSPCLSAGMAKVAAMSNSAFHKRCRYSYDSSPSPTLLVRKRYTGTSELILGTDSEEDEEVEESLDSDSESEDVEDEGPTTEDEYPTAEDEGLAVGVEGLDIDDERYGLDGESHSVDDESHGLDGESYGIDGEGRGIESDGLGLGEEDVVPEGHQHTVLVVRTAVSEPLGLGYRALRHLELALKKDHVYNTFEAGHGSGSTPEPGRSERVSAFRQPTLTTWIDPEDDIDRDVKELYTRSGAVKDEIFSQRYLFRSLEHEKERTVMTFRALWRPVLALEAWAGRVDTQMTYISRAGYDDHRLVYDMLLQQTALQQELQEMRDRVTVLEQ
nr:hypothetical protein [Tanacetum cinerariifolium]